MNTINQIDSAACNMLRSEINNTIALITSKYGVSLTMGTISYNMDQATAKLTMRPINGRPVSTFTTSGLVTLDPKLIGRSFKFRTKIFVITGFNPNSRKFVVTARNNNGTSYRFPATVLNDLI